MPRSIPFSKPPDLGRHTSQRERDAFYTGRPWRTLRAAHLAAHPLCLFCLGLGRTIKANVVDHVVERLVDPSRALDPTNLRSLCNPCHTRHHKTGPGRRA
ncbi:MAG: HNH endonuclease [Parafilimonas terrae]|nr:HNH endonuclease [Parafilimonas terrae]